MMYVLQQWFVTDNKVLEWGNPKVTERKRWVFQVRVVSPFDVRSFVYLINVEWYSQLLFSVPYKIFDIPWLLFWQRSRCHIGGIRISKIFWMCSNLKKNLGGWYIKYLCIHAGQINLYLDQWNLHVPLYSFVHVAPYFHDLRSFQRKLLPSSSSISYSVGLSYWRHRLLWPLFQTYLFQREV